MISYVRATVEDLIPTIELMAPRDVAEMVPWPVILAPNYDLYRKIEELGKFRGFLAKDGETPVGYAWYFINAHAHFKDHLWAVVDDFWLDPAYRRGRIALRFFEFIEKSLIESVPGLTAIMQGTRAGHMAAERLFAHMGYEALDTRVIKMLGVPHA